MSHLTLLKLAKGIGAWLLRHWKEITVLIILLVVWLHGHSEGREEGKAELQELRVQLAAERLESVEAARKQEQEWSAAFDLSLGLHQENMNETLSQRDRIIAGLRSGRLSFRASCSAVPAVAADSPAAETGAESGQPGLVGEAITARLAQCDEVTHERNLAVSLLEAERLP